MKRVSKLVGIVSKPLQKRYLKATDAQREALKETVDRESKWMIEKMAARGYRMEARVAEVYGLFTRGPARGAIRMVKTADPQEVLVGT